MKLTNQELLECKAGAGKGVVAGIVGAVITFIIGFVDGYFRKLSCN